MDNGPSHQTQVGVLKYNRNEIFESPVEVEEMNFGRSGCGCTIFNSPAHNGRSVLIVVGGTSSERNAEIWDYSVEGSKWQTSIFILNLVFET